VWTLLGTSFGLTVAAIVTAANETLPLHQGIVVTYLVWLANFALLMSLASYARHPHPSKATQLVAILQTYFSTACTLYLWVKAPSFGYIAFTDQTVFVVLFRSTSAVGHGRIVALTVVAAMLLGYSILVFAFLARRAHETKGSTPQFHLIHPQHNTETVYSPHFLSIRTS
jgi:hypothetical protein